MKLNREIAESTFRVLGKCTEEAQPSGPWRWSSAVCNGTRLQVESSLSEGFLALASRTEGAQRSGADLEHALLGNHLLPGGVGLALGTDGLHLRTDIALPENAQQREEHVLGRLRWALSGFHHGAALLKSLDMRSKGRAQRHAVLPDADLAGVLGSSTWKSEPRGANEFSAALDANGAPPARIRMTELGLQLSVELGFVATGARESRSAIPAFLLSVGRTLRMAHANATESDGGWSFGFRVCLPPAPLPEEIDHGLAALSLAHRIAAREASVLLDETAAACYLAAREIATTNQPNEDQGE
jgi:hypothetical protein